MARGLSWRGTQAGRIDIVTIAPALFALVLVTTAWLWNAPRWFPLDDAYIHLAYGKSLALSGSLGLNPGEASLGTSSPLWALCLVPLFWLQSAPFWSVHALTAACTAGYVVVGVGLLFDMLGALRLDRATRRAFAALGGVLLATNGSLAWMSLSGMETPLVLFVCALTVRRTVREGPGLRTGLLLGACLLARTTTLALFVSLVLIELWGPRPGRARGLVRLVSGAVAAYLPYAFYTWHVGHTIVPNTAKGKLLTYVSSGLQVDEWLHFLGRALALHQYLPLFALFGVAFAAAVVLWKRGVGVFPGDAVMLQSRSVRSMRVLLVWSIVHVAQYTVGFRTIGQQGRYLAEWLFAVTLLGVVGVAYCARATRRVWVPWCLGAVLSLAQLVALPYWWSVYRNNAAHVESAYGAMAQWIESHTEPDARIATFDIGVVRYLGDRYTIDLGGLVDPSTHPCLVRRSCAEYVRAQKADYVMYPRDPNSDRITGVQRAEFAPRWLLRESLVAQFEAQDYAAPTLTHSFRLQLFRVDGWFDRDEPAEALRAFERGSTALTATSFAADPGVEVVGFALDATKIRYVREYPYDLTLWLAYRATQPLRQARWLHVILFDPAERRTVHSFDVALTDAVLLPEQMPLGKTLEEHRTLDIPADLRAGRYRIRAHVSAERVVDVRYPQLYQWLELGELDVARSKTTALAPL